MKEGEVQAAVETMARQARAAALKLSQLSTEKKNAILLAMAAGLRAATAEIVEANAKDIAAGEEKGLGKAMLDRLRLDEARVDAIAGGIEQVAALPDPVGEVMEKWKRPNGMRLEQVRVPIGTIGIIFESRPNVTSDAAVLCFKTGNATILRGGSEAIHSNRAIAKALQEAGAKEGLPDHAIQLVPFTDRSSVTALCQMDQWLDVIIPRGGKGLIETVVAQARMPVIKHYDGICHVYVDATADLDMAVSLVVNSKTQKPGVCNALETLLVHSEVAGSFLPVVADALKAKGVELRGCEHTQVQIDCLPATEEDWGTEYLDLILSIKVVDSLEDAVSHINTHGSHHTDCIVTADENRAELFLNSVDSACVFHNVSTRFADGEEFGFGAEIGISTEKLHARGPMGLRELTSYQYRVRGEGQIRG
ncbi:glutamate-5-semialdehyde dehydrogenase [Haloferula chungangensis]|uniref:Gamma-glutamyl phosphate reductase n=1 Tax=Haloferula chungangensis TaxID=1048331 RepID=A0ABW2L073_9BACT